MKPIPFVSLLLLASLASGQTQTLRGSVEVVSGTNQFLIACTEIPATSTVLELETLIGDEMIFEVVDIGTAAEPLLDIGSATPTSAVFEMGNLRIRRAGRWVVHAPAGSLAFVFLDFTFNTGFHPFLELGTFVLGADAVTLATGVTTGQDQFAFNFVPPEGGATFIGASFTGQALVGDHGTWFFSNPDCRVMQAQ
jgi:hypothetical protein